MLIESNTIHDRIKELMNDAEESELNFSSYKAVISCLKQLKISVAALEAAQTQKNAEQEYSDAIEGLRNR